jgi:hypothetical protein
MIEMRLRRFNSFVGTAYIILLNVHGLSYKLAKDRPCLILHYQPSTNFLISLELTVSSMHIARA